MKMKFIFFLLMFTVSGVVFAQKPKKQKPINQEKSGNEFTYADCSCAVTVDLQIHNGLYGSYGGQAIAEADETTKGAVTVANKNDTDGDGNIDNVDNSVVATPNGRDEVDLMKLVITSNGMVIPACSIVKLQTSGNIRLWEQSTKITPASTAIPIASLPQIIWVDATEPSNSVRDMSITAILGGIVKDKVKITSVWVEFVRKYKIKTNAGVENSSALTLGINQPLLVNLIDNFLVNKNGERYGLGEAALFNSANYTGMCSTTNFSGENSAYAATILTEYEIELSDLRLEPNLLGVKFDFARQVDADEEIIYEAKYVWQQSPELPDLAYLGGEEGSNDDGTPAATANADEDLTPSSNNKIYSIDAAGFFYDGYFDPDEVSGKKIVYWKRNLEFVEFARISFMNQPMGDGIVAQGSRCSDYIDWQTSYTVNRKSITGVLDPYDGCNHIYAQVNSPISHSAVLRVSGTGNTNINVNLLSTAGSSGYQFEFDKVNMQWTLMRGDNTGLSTFGPFSLNTTTNSWTLTDLSNVEIMI